MVLFPDLPLLEGTIRERIIIISGKESNEEGLST